jgi:hypothetical protein
MLECVDPHGSVVSLFLSSTGDYRESINAADSGLDLVDTGFVRVALLIQKIDALNALGERLKANKVMDQALVSAAPERESMLAGTLASLGRMREAEQLLAALERIEQPSTYLMAQTYAKLGDDRAFDWIRRGIDGHIGLVVWFLREDRTYSMLRKDPQWAEIMSRLEAEEAKGSSGQNHQS